MPKDRKVKIDGRDDVITVRTDNRERKLYVWNDLPANAQDDFDYVKDTEREDMRFVRYLGSWYDVNDTEGVAPNHFAALGWSTYITDSFFSGVLFRHFTTDGDYMNDTVVVGRFWC